MSLDQARLCPFTNCLGILDRAGHCPCCGYQCKHYWLVDQHQHGRCRACGAERDFEMEWRGVHSPSLESDEVDKRIRQAKDIIWDNNRSLP